MKASELRELTDEELRQRLADARQELFDVRIQKSVGQLEHPLRLRTLRRSVAQLLTVMQQRGIS